MALFHLGFPRCLPAFGRSALVSRTVRRAPPGRLTPVPSARSAGPPRRRLALDHRNPLVPARIAAPSRVRYAALRRRGLTFRVTGHAPAWPSTRSPPTRTVVARATHTWVASSNKNDARIYRYLSTGRSGDPRVARRRTDPARRRVASTTSRIDEWLTRRGAPIRRRVADPVESTGRFGDPSDRPVGRARTAAPEPHRSPRASHEPAPWRILLYFLSSLHGLRAC